MRRLTMVAIAALVLGLGGYSALRAQPAGDDGPGRPGPGQPGRRDGDMGPGQPGGRRDRPDGGMRPPGPPPHNWEFRVLKEKLGVEQLEATLNAAGAEGWDLAYFDAGGKFAVLKRGTGPRMHGPPGGGDGPRMGGRGGEGDRGPRDQGGPGAPGGRGGDRRGGDSDRQPPPPPADRD